MTQHQSGERPGRKEPLPGPREGTDSPTALGEQALQAFWRDLPRLWQDRPHQWVAYHGDRQLGFADTRTELWQECLRRGLGPGEFLIRSIEPEDPDLVSGLPT